MTRSSTTWTMTRTSLLRTSKPSVIANLGIPSSDTRIHLTVQTPHALCCSPRLSNQRSTTSTSIKEVTTSFLCSTLEKQMMLMLSFICSCRNKNKMVNTLERSSAEPVSLAPSGKSPLQSPPSSWPPRNTFPARSPVTPTMTMTQTTMLLSPTMMMIEPEDCFWLCGKRTGYLFFSLFMFPPASYVEGTSLATSFCYQDSCLICKSA